LKLLASRLAIQYNRGIDHPWLVCRYTRDSGDAMKNADSPENAAYAAIQPCSVRQCLSRFQPFSFWYAFPVTDSVIRLKFKLPAKTLSAIYH
jgi:hypothetical protein